MNSRNPWIGILLIVFVGGALGLGYNALQPRALPWIAHPKPVVTLDSLAHSSSETPTTQDQPGEPINGNTSPQVSKTVTPKEPIHPTSDAEKASSAPRPRQQASVPPSPVETTAPVQSDPPAADRAETAPEHGSPPATASAFSDIPESEYPIEIHLAKTKELYDRGGLVILDARETEEYAEGHIRGAQSAPGEVMPGDLEWLDRMSKEPRPILVYCGGGDCELSINLGFELTRAGHRRVLVFKEGYPAWKDAGYPVAEGAAQ